MYKVLIIILIILYSSCCNVNNEINYKYNDVVITRIDKCSETSFYYTQGEKRSAGRIWAKYSGINDGFAGYLKFDNNGKVTLLSGDGYFQTEDIDTSKFAFKSILADEVPEMGPGVYYITLATRYEKERNNDVLSKVITEYYSDSHK